MAFNAWPKRPYIMSEDCVYPGDDDYEDDNPWPGEDDNWQEAVNALREDVEALSETVTNLAEEVADITVPTKVSQLQNDSGYQTAAQVQTAISGKLDTSQGVAHAGDFLVVGSDGNITAVTMTAWQGGSY